MFDTKALAEATAVIAKAHVAAAVEPLLRRIDELEKRQPERGEPGPPGRDGADGKDGADGRNGVDGRDGLPGVDGINGKDGVDGKDGADGKDGVSLAGAMIDREGQLIVTLSNGEHRSLGGVVGRDGADGRDGCDGAPGEKGKDGFSLKEFDASLMDDGRTVLLKFDDGSDISYAVELGFPAMIYRGVYREGSYDKGDTVTFGGSLWHSNKDGNTDKPDGISGAWTLAAKRGRDGKEVVTLKPRKDEPVKV